jgi:hypothetical protein
MPVRIAACPKLMALELGVAKFGLLGEIAGHP